MKVGLPRRSARAERIASGKIIRLNASRITNTPTSPPASQEGTFPNAPFDLPGVAVAGAVEEGAAPGVAEVVTPSVKAIVAVGAGRVAVAAGLDVAVGAGFEVAVGAGFGVDVAVGFGVEVAVGLGVDVAVGEGFRVGVGVWVANAAIPAVLPCACPACGIPSMMSISPASSAPQQVISPSRNSTADGSRVNRSI